MHGAKIKIKILRINFAPSWLYLQDHTGKQGQQNIKFALYYVLKTDFAWRLDHKKYSTHVSSITDSQTEQAQICTDTQGHETVNCA
jgi:uncharacterized protein (DUF2249 family)